jgi:hypothetical protein
MHIDEIREKITVALFHHTNWYDALDDTSPGHYGVDDIACEVDLTHVWVNIRERTFTFRSACLSFNARLLASSDWDGVDMSFTRTVSGHGKFDFGGRGGIDVTSFEINEKIDLFGEDARV